MSTPITPIPQNTYASFEPPPPTVADEINPDNPPWGIPGGVGLWLLSVMLIVIMPAMFLLPYAQQRGIGLETLAEFATTDKTAIFLQVLSLIPTHLVTLALAWALVTRLGKRPFFRTLGWTWGERFDLRKSVGLALGLYAVGFIIIILIGGPETQLAKIISSSRPTAFLTALMATATAPLVEEVIYRGLLYSGLRKTIGTAGAVVSVFLLFSLVHVPQYWPHFGIMLTICMLSLVLTLVRAWTKSLLPCFIIHLVFNGVQSVLIVFEPYFEKYLPERLQGAHLPSLVEQVFGLFA